jgi:hypothetical protein
VPSTFDQNVKSILDRIRSQAPPPGAAAPAQSQTTGYGSTFSPSWTPAPSRPAAQPTSSGPNWRALWDKIRNIGGEPGPADDVARAREANAKRERQRAAAEKAVEARQKQFESGPWGLTFNPESTKPFQREPGINFAGGRTDARKAEDIAAARAERAKQSIADYDRKAQMDSDSRTENIVELTTEQWNALTPAQQDAVQFNTNLVKAIERDRANQGSYAPSDDQRQEYNRILTDVLGTRRRP